MKFQLMLQLKAMSVTMAMQQKGSVSMSVAHISIRDHEDVPGLGSCLGAWLISKGYRTGPILPCLLQSGQLVLLLICGIIQKQTVRWHRQKVVQYSFLHQEFGITGCRVLRVGEMFLPLVGR